MKMTRNITEKEWDFEPSLVLGVEQQQQVHSVLGRQKDLMLCKEPGNPNIGFKPDVSS